MATTESRDNVVSGTTTQLSKEYWQIQVRLEPFIEANSFNILPGPPSLLLSNFPTDQELPFRDD